MTLQEISYIRRFIGVVEGVTISLPEKVQSLIYDYIDAEILLKQLRENEPMNWTDSDTELQEQSDYDSFKELINEQPTANIEEVKYGKWELHSDGSGTCSRCKTTQKHIWDIDNIQNYCGHCGAKMDEKRE